MSTFLEKLIRNWPLDSSSLELIASAERNYQLGIDDEIGWSRQAVVDSVVEFCAFTHFGFDKSTRSLQGLISSAIQKGIEFYFGDWHKPDNVRAWCKNRGLSEADTSFELSRCGYLQEPRLLEPWRDTLSNLMLLCLLTDNSSAIAKISDWFCSEMKPEYTGLYHETELTTLVLASYFRSKPMEGMKNLIDRISSCKRKHAVARLRLFQSCIDGNQGEFSDSLPEALDFYYKKREPFVLSNLLAIDESSAVIIATSKGLEIPELSEKHRWALMSKVSIGL